MDVSYFFYKLSIFSVLGVSVCQFVCKCFSFSLSLSVRLYIPCPTDGSGSFWRHLCVYWTCQPTPLSHLCLPVKLVSHRTRMIDVSGSLLATSGPYATQVSSLWSKDDWFVKQFLQLAFLLVTSGTAFLRSCISTFAIWMINAIYSLFSSCIYLFLWLPFLLTWFLSPLSSSLPSHLSLWISY